nr:MAG TPA: hypothetical protein [Caudoviricetes sp.]
MGAINYGTSDIITLAIKPYDPDDLDDLAHDKRAAYIADDYAADYANAAAIINNYDDFSFFRIRPAWGYYEGVYIELLDNFWPGSWADKRDALKEATRLKRLLLDLADVGFIRCTPGWCTGYSDHKGTLAAIRSAIQELKQRITRAKIEGY